MAMLCTFHNTLFFHVHLRTSLQPSQALHMSQVSWQYLHVSFHALLSQQSVGSFSSGSCLPFHDLHQEPEVWTRHMLSTTHAILSIPTIPSEWQSVWIYFLHQLLILIRLNKPRNSEFIFSHQIQLKLPSGSNVSTQGGPTMGEHKTQTVCSFRTHFWWRPS